MMLKKSLILTGALSLLSLGACSSGPNIKEGQFWQQASMEEAIYKQGPKAQKLLDRDIAGCVVDLRERQGMDTIREAIPASTNSAALENPDEQRLAEWDAPDHDGALLAEHTDYQDMEGCMKARGWKRTKFVPFDVAHEARANWYLANTRYGYDPRVGKPGEEPKPAADGAFSKLNN